MAPDASPKARYSNFDIRIEEREASYRAVVMHSPAGEAKADFNLPFSEDRLENLVLKISNSIGAARRQTRRIGSAQRRQVEEFGSALFDAVFTGEVKEVFDRSRDKTSERGAGLRIRLRLGDAPGLINIPWEYLYDRVNNEFLALSPDTPLYRYAELQRTAPALQVAPPLRLLVMVSQPSDVSELSGGVEWEKLQGELEDLTRRGLVEPALVEPATRAGLEAALKQEPCHILHFIGHGGFDEDSDDGGLIFEGRDRRSVLVTGRDLGIALGPFHSLRLVVLNACEGARGSLKDPFGGAAQALVRQGIPAVVAMQFEVTDDAAVTFARAFYERIALQDPIDAALGWARRAIFADENVVEWATPVLYMRSPTGRIFARGDAETSQAAEERERVQREQQERERVQREQQERERVQREQQERERVQREQQERERVQREQQERERVQREQQERERVQREQQERERVQHEQQERERVQHEQQERDSATRTTARRLKVGYVLGFLALDAALVFGAYGAWGPDGKRSAFERSALLLVGPWPTPPDVLWFASVGIVLLILAAALAWAAIGGRRVVLGLLGGAAVVCSILFVSFVTVRALGDDQETYGGGWGTWVVIGAGLGTVILSLLSASRRPTEGRRSDHGK